MTYRVTQEVLELMKLKEGNELQAYIDPVGIPTIGYGKAIQSPEDIAFFEKSTGVKWEGLKTNITQEQSDKLFADTVDVFADGMRELDLPFQNDSQFGSSVSLAYNIGLGAFKGSTVARRIRAQDYEGAAEAFKMWNKGTVDGKKVVLRGLVTRRQAEADLFLSGKNYEPPVGQTPTTIAPNMGRPDPTPTLPQAPAPSINQSPAAPGDTSVADTGVIPNLEPAPEGNLSTPSSQRVTEPTVEITPKELDNPVQPAIELEDTTPLPTGQNTNLRDLPDTNALDMTSKDQADAILEENVQIQQDKKEQALATEKKEAILSQLSPENDIPDTGMMHPNLRQVETVIRGEKVELDVTQPVQMQDFMDSDLVKTAGPIPFKKLPKIGAVSKATAAEQGSNAIRQESKKALVDNSAADNRILDQEPQLTNSAFLETEEESTSDPLAGIGAINKEDIARLRPADAEFAPLDDPIGEVPGGDSFRAGFSRESFVSTGIVQRAFADAAEERDLNFNSHKAVEGTEWAAPQYMKAINRAKNPQHLKRIIKKLESNEKRLMTMLANPGIGTLASMGGSLADPAAYIAVLGVAGKLTRAARAVRFATNAGVVVGGLEVPARALDHTRTFEESLANTAGAVVFGGLIGAAFPSTAIDAPGMSKFVSQSNDLFTRTEPDVPTTTFSKSLDKEIKSAERVKDSDDMRPVPGIDEVIPTERGIEADTRIGFDANIDIPKRTATQIADENDRIFGFDRPGEGMQPSTKADISGKDFTIAGSENPIYRKVLKMGRGFNMITRGLTAGAKKVRSLTSDLFSHNFRLRGADGKNVAKNTSLEAKIRMDGLEGKRLSDDLSDVHSKYKGTGDNNLTLRQMKAKIYDEINNPGTTKSKAVREGAELTRARFDRGFQRAVKAGVIDAAQFRKNYTPRVFDIDKVSRNLPAFRQALSEGLQETNPSLTGKELSVAVDESINRILDPTTPLFRSFEFKSASSKQRVMDIDNRFIEDFVVRDVDELSNRYFKDLSIETNFKERFGNTDLAPQIADIIAEYDELIKAAGNNPKKAFKLQKEKAQSVMDIENARDVLQGRFGQSKSEGLRKFEKAMLAWNTTTMLGLSAIAQIADFARMIGVVKLGGSTKFKNFAKGVGKEIQKVELSKADWRYIQEGLDTQDLYAASRFSDFTEVQSLSTKFDRGTDRFVEGFFRLNLMTSLNNWSRKVSLNHIVNNILEGAGKWKQGKASQTEIDALLKQGIDVQQRDLILDLVKKHGDVKDGVLLPNFHKWGREGSEIVAGLKSEVDNVIFIPGAGDKPTWMKKSVFRLGGQFKGFSSAAFTRGFLPNLQDLFDTGGEAALVAASRMFAGFIFGSMAYVARQKVKNQEVDYSTGRLVVEGFDRGGVFPIFSDINNILDSVNIGLGSMLETGKASRFMHNDVMAPLLGPSASRINDLFKAAAAFKDGSITDSEMRLLVRQAPLYNLLYWNWLTANIGK